MIALCAAAAGIALYAASRTWLVEVIPRPDPLPASTEARTGSWLVPLLPALALVALAGAGGLLATRGLARTVVAALVALVGLAIPVSLSGVVSRPGIAVGWVLVAMLAGVAMAVVGAVAIRRGGSWPTMGSRYERPGTAGRAPRRSSPSDASRPDSDNNDDDNSDDNDDNDNGPDDTVDHGPMGDIKAVGAHGRGVKAGTDSVGTDQLRQRGTADNLGYTSDIGVARLWDALDRGEDPTKE